MQQLSMDQVRVIRQCSVFTPRVFSPARPRYDEGGADGAGAGTVSGCGPG